MREKKIIMQKTLLAKSQNKPIREKANIIVMAQIWPKSIFGPLLKTRNALGSSAIPKGLKDQ